MAFATATPFGTLNADPMKKTALISLLILGSCSRSPQGDIKPNLQPGFDAISSNTLLSEIKTLSSDDFEGRKPGSAGEQKPSHTCSSSFSRWG